MGVIKDYELGDMLLRYSLDERGIAGLQLLPLEMSRQKLPEKEMEQENLVQIKYAGDIYNEAYAQGLTMRNGESVRRLLYDRQESDEAEDKVTIRTYLKDERGYEVIHIVEWEKGDTYLSMYNIFTNCSDEVVSLEMFESFSLGGLTPFAGGDAYESMEIYRIRSVWSGEGKVCVDSVEDLALEKSWSDHAVRCERYGQVGSMPVNHFFPMGAVHDKKNHVFWGAQIAHNASWQMEIYRKDAGLSFSGGLADREFGHWMKNIAPRECFSTPVALVSVARIDTCEEYAEHAAFDLFMQRLTSSAKKTIAKQSELEQTLPVIFNEYCTTWGNPSHENIRSILNAIRGKGFSYFVIDCGWYKQEGIPWDKGMGDYEVSSLLFPEGLQKTVDMIKKEGLHPGIWFEIENVASEAKAYQLTEHLLQKDGTTLTSYFRRFWKMTDPWVEAYLTEKVIGTLKQYGFEYMKIDYNETIGIGCDGAESFGEALRQNMEASRDFIVKVKEEIPDIILENCASGGHRLEPLMMSLCAMASFSDAHECQEIPIIAAWLHRVIHPAQSQIWAVIRREDSIQRITYSIANTLLGRMCISGDVTELSPKQWKAIDDGIAFYKEVAPIIKDGTSILYGSALKSVRHPVGWQGVVRATKKESLVVIHTFGGKLPECICIKHGMQDGAKIESIYGENVEEKEVKINGLYVTISPKNNFEAIAIHLYR